MNIFKKRKNKKIKKSKEFLKKYYEKPIINDIIKDIVEREKTTNIINKKINEFGFDIFDDFFQKEFEISQCVLKIDVIEKILDKKFKKIKNFVLDNVNNYDLRKEAYNQYSDKNMNDFKIIDYLIQMYCHFSFTSFENQVFYSKFMKENHYPNLDDIKSNDDIYLIE